MGAMGVIKDNLGVDDSDPDEMDSNESDKSSLHSDSSDNGSDFDDSSEMDEEECEKRRGECVQYLIDLEKQFNLLREQLYRERYTEVDSKLLEIRSGRAPEYLQPLAQLQENMRTRTEVAGILKELAVESINCQVDAEKVASEQNLISEQNLTRDRIMDGLLAEIRRLEEDRNNVDTVLWDTETPHRGAGSRRKPVTVSGPYIIYMLSEADILEDWSLIKKAMAATNKRKSEI